MDNFDLKKYLAEGRLFEEVNPIWVIDAFEDSADIEQAGPAYKNAVIDIIKSKHPDISDKDLEASIEVMNVTWYNEARSNAKGSEPEEMKVSAEDFADGAIEHYEDIIVFDNNNLAEGRLFENTINQISSRIVKLGKEAGISSDDIEEYVDGLESSFEPDAYKNITDKELLKDLKLAVKNLAEGRLFENTINQISSRIVKLGKEAGISSDDIEEYVDGLESSFEPDAYKNITDKELLKDLKLAVKNLAEGRINEEDLENGLDNKIWDFRHLIKNFDPLDIKVGDTVITPTEGENIIDKIVKYGWDFNYGDIINFQFGNRSLSNKDLIQRNNRRK